MKTPIISVVMPVYNGEKYLKEAIDSILNQTFTDFEFIILNDGSTDGTEEIILSYDDPRIVYVKNEENLQIVKTLNKGITLAKGKYIARMDADDISLPTRFEKQVEYMERHPEVGVCGTWIEKFGHKTAIDRYSSDHQRIKVELLFNSAIAHPSAIMKKALFDELEYEQKYEKAEDYALWIRASNKYRLSNINSVLLKYRIHTSQTQKNVQIKKANAIRAEQLSSFGDIIGPNEIDILNMLATYSYVLPIEIRAFRKKILLLNKNKIFFNDKLLKEEIGKRYWWMLNANTKLGLRVFFDYRMSPVNQDIRVTILEKLKFFLKCIIRYET